MEKVIMSATKIEKDKKLTPAQDAYYRKLMVKNFEWAMNMLEWLKGKE